MATKSGNATALTVLSPIKNGNLGETSFADITRERCLRLPIHEESPWLKYPTPIWRACLFWITFFMNRCPLMIRFLIFPISRRFFPILHAKALPRKDTLKSKYLVFSSNFHGDLDTYLTGVWEKWSYIDHEGTQRDVRHIWEHCVAFDRVTDASSFIAYIKRCQLDASLFFNGSTDDSLQEQLKSLYLKQEFTKFAVEHQGKSASEIQQDFKAFIARVQPENLEGPTWQAGKSTP